MRATWERFLRDGFDFHLLAAPRHATTCALRSTLGLNGNQVLGTEILDELHGGVLGGVERLAAHGAGAV